MQSLMVHSFSKAPSADIPRSQFDRSFGHKTTFDAGKLIPVFHDEVLPGDTFNCNATIFARMNTPIYPLMDNLYMDLHFFFVPYRLIWDNFRKFCGEQIDPGDSTDYTIPTMLSYQVYANQSIFDYLGLPTNIANQYTHSVLPLRAYNLIYREWYRDQNLVDSPTVHTGDSGDAYADYTLLSRGKRHDYFTSCLPWPQKGTPVSLPVTGTPYVRTAAPDGNDLTIWQTGSNEWSRLAISGGTSHLQPNSTGSSANNLYVNLAGSTNITINDLRRSTQIQKMLERDARSGTRYSEIVNAHFGVDFLDVTYRPEYLGGSSAPVNFQTVASTNEGTRGLGDLAATGTILCNGGFTKSFTEHGLVMGIASVRADLTYQQGLERMWSRSTRYDFFWPALSHIGEQAVPTKEIYCTGTASDDVTFGYQERWAEYRYKPSRITGKLRSNDVASLDAWHLSQEFTAAPTLNETFITENPPMDRVVAVTNEPDFTMDSYFKLICARPMPLFSVPGLMDHF